LVLHIPQACSAGNVTGIPAVAREGAQQKMTKNMLLTFVKPVAWTVPAATVGEWKICNDLQHGMLMVY
jgi:hypothetical protein